jgi:hypothetical protein
LAERPTAEPAKPRRQDNTERFIKLARNEFGSIAGSFEKKVRRLKMYVALVISIAAAGFAASSYLGRDTRRIDALEIKMDFVVDQVKEIAASVGAKETKFEERKR